VGVRGFMGRISIFLSLIFGTALSWILDRVFGTISSLDPGVGKITEHFRVNWDGVMSAPWIGFPPHTTGVGANEIVGWHGPTFSAAAVLLVLPIVIALIAENTGHVKAVAEMTGNDLDDVMGKAIAADGFATVVASAVGGSPTTTYAENIGVMAATRVYSTAAYYVAAVVAIVVGLSPKFGALVAATPGGVLGGIVVILYGMIGLLGAKIWIENKVNFGNPINLVPVAAGIVIGIGNTSLVFSDTFSLSGIAFGTIITIVAYHIARMLAPDHMKDGAGGAVITVGGKGTEKEAQKDVDKVR
jgi:xanthine/uracil permease